MANASASYSAKPRRKRKPDAGMWASHGTSANQAQARGQALVLALAQAKGPDKAQAYAYWGSRCRITTIREL